MPWVKIPPENLLNLALFGYDFIKDDGEFAWYHGPHGRMHIEKAKPCVYVDDIGEAHQLGAIGVLKNS